MFERIIAFSLRQRLLVLIGTFALAVGGVFAFWQLPIDAVPDVTNNQVQVLTQAPALSPLEVEQLVTRPVELALKSLPDVVELRSLSRSGISVITVVFEESVETYFGRQLILERLREVDSDLPDEVETPQLGPASTGLGEIVRYVVRDESGAYSAMELRTIQDWIIRRNLLGVPGLAEVNSIGGYLKQYQILVDPAKLVEYGLTLREVFQAASDASGTGGGGYIERGPEQLTVRSVGLVQSIGQLARTVIRSVDGTPVVLADVAEVAIGPALRFGAATEDGKGEVVTGIAMQLKGANARVVVSAVKDRVAEIQEMLPEGVYIEPYYDRTELVERTIFTVGKNLGEGAVLVILVLLLLLAHLRSGLILASVIPLAMLFAVIMMVLTGQTGNLMSLGAIDFGLVVDGSLIIVESVLRLLSSRQSDGTSMIDDCGMKQLVYSGAVEMVSAAKFGVFIIIIVYLPIMSLEGIEGKLFRPMALTVSFALIGALILSVTYVPAMCSLFLQGRKPVRHSPIVEWIGKVYRPLLGRALQHGKPLVGATLALLALSVFGFTRLGGEFIPKLDEGDLSIQIIRLPSVSLTESLKITGEVERRIAAFAEVKTMVSNTGRAEVSTDPMGVEVSDAYVILNPMDEWPLIDGHRRSKAELVEAMSHAAEEVAGAGFQFLQPIEMRTNELIAGVRGDLAMKIYGESYDVMNPLAEQIAGILRQTRGAADVTVEQTSGFPQLVIVPDREAMARYGLRSADINTLIETAVGGKKAGEIYEGERRFDLVVRFGDQVREDVSALRKTLVPVSSGARVPLETLAAIRVEEGPAQISRDDGSRYVTVQANIRGRDVASFVADVQEGVGSELSFPPGYRLEYGGQFENLRAATRRLSVVVPLALLLIFLLLFQTFGSVRIGVLIFLAVPMAVIGGVAGLFLSGLPFSISAGVGFIALFGIAVLNGIVMVAAFRKFEREGMDRLSAVIAGSDERLRPVITTATLAALGFVPMLLARSAGAEVQRPLATVVIGGIVTSTLLTLFILPIVYTWFGGPALSGPESTEPAHFTPVRRGKTSAGPVVVGALLFLTLCVPAGSALAQQGADAISLEEARARALEVSPLLSIGTARLDRARAHTRSAGMLPDTEAFYVVDGERLDGASTVRETGVGVGLDFPLFGMAADKRTATRRASLSEIELLGLNRAVLLEVDLSYVRLQAAQAQLALADSAVSVARTFWESAVRRQELGETGPLEALQARVAFSESVRAKAAATGDHLAARSGLALLLQMDPGRDLVAEDPLGHLGPLHPASDRLDTAARASPEVATRQAALAVAEAQAKTVRTGRLPSPRLELSSQTRDGGSGFFGATVGLTIPLSRWFNHGPDREAEAGIAIAKAELGLARQEVRTRMADLLARYEASRREGREYDETILPQARESYRIALRLRALGDASYLEVLSAQTILIASERAATESHLLEATLRAQITALEGLEADEWHTTR